MVAVLLAWKCQHLEPHAAVLFLHRHEAEIPGVALCQVSVRRNVNNQGHCAHVLGEINGIAADVNSG